MLRALGRVVESVAVGSGVLLAGMYISREWEKAAQGQPYVSCGLCGEKQTAEEFLDPSETCSCVRVRR